MDGVARRDFSRYSGESRIQHSQQEEHMRRLNIPQRVAIVDALAKDGQAGHGIKSLMTPTASEGHGI
jgi:hypothetical protein